MRNKGYINNFNNLRIQDLKMMQHNNLVKYLLPAHLLDRMFGNSQMSSDLTEEYKDATILFADIAGYTKYSKGQAPETVVNTLRKLFTEFDKLCLKHNVYKVYTIGDCYVVLGIVDANHRDESLEAKNVIEMAFSMIEVIRKVRVEINFNELDMRIGIHTGDFIGGITGTNIVRYDIYGINVTIANKMESNGKVGQVHVSHDTKNTIEIKFPDHYEFVLNEEGPLKLATMDSTVQSYFVNKKLYEEQEQDYDFFFENINYNQNQEEENDEEEDQ